MTNEILDVFMTLTKRQQELLTYANKEVICQYVEYEPGKYIGIDARYNKKLIPMIKDGLWSLGNIKDGK